MDAAFGDVEDAIKVFLQGFQYTGVALGAVGAQAAIPNLTVVLSGPAIIYQQTQEPIHWSSPQTVNVAVDENGVTTAVAGAPNEKWVSIFAEFVRAPSDARIDGRGDTVLYLQDESFKLNVVQGAEAAVGLAVRPGFRGDQILVADVRLIFGQVAVLNADISVTRSQLVYIIAGVPNSIRERNLNDVLAAILAIANGVSINAALLAANNIFTGTNTFRETVKLIHADVPLGSEARLDLTEASVVPYVLLLEETINVAPLRISRTYKATYSGGFSIAINGIVITTNARWNGGTEAAGLWIPDVVGDPADMVTMASGASVHASLSATPASWLTLFWLDATATPKPQGTAVVPGLISISHPLSVVPSLLLGFDPATDPTGRGMKIDTLSGLESTLPSRFVRTYRGNGAFLGPSGYVRTINARYEPSNDSWNADNPAQMAMCWRMKSPGAFDNFEALSKLVTAVPWFDSQWDTDPGDTVLAGSQGSMVVSGRFKYPATRTRTVSSGQLVGGVDPFGIWSVQILTPWAASGAGGTLCVPIRLPRRAILKRVSAYVSSFAGGTKLTIGSLTQPFGTAALYVLHNTIGQDTSAPGDHVIYVDYTAIQAENLSFVAFIESTGADILYDLQVTYDYTEAPEQISPFS
jgi:hypothetical protein